MRISTCSAPSASRSNWRRRPPISGFSVMTVSTSAPGFACAETCTAEARIGFEASPAKSMMNRRRPSGPAPDERPHDAEEAVEVGHVPAPGQAIGERDLASRRHRARRPPVGDDVVVDLVVRRDLDEHDVPLAPGADRLDPDARLAVELAGQVLVGLEALLALDEAEAARAGVGEGADLEQPRRVQRPPQPFVRAVPHREAVGVVDGEAVVVVLAVVLGVEEEHRGQGREAEVGDLVAGEDRRLDVDLGDVPGPQGEAEGAGGALAVEERVDDDAVAGGRLDPVGAEEGELLALRPRRCRWRGRGRWCRRPGPREIAWK